MNETRDAVALNAAQTSANMHGRTMMAVIRDGQVRIVGKFERRLTDKVIGKREPKSETNSPGGWEGLF